MLKIGDKVMRTPTLGFKNEEMCIGSQVEAVVIWIHPRGRFHVVRFDFKRMNFKECYWGVEK